MIPISKIAIFLAVVKHESFAAAARDMGMTGPALSKQVKALEDELGVRLLNRTTRQVTLTEEGAIYHERARKAVEDLEEAKRQIQDLKNVPTGLLRISAPMSFGKKYLVGPIAAFAKKYPDVQLDIDFDDRHVDIIAEGYDVAVRIGALKDSSLIARKLAPFSVLLCASPVFIEKYGEPQTPEDLHRYPAILFNKHSNTSEWRYTDPNGQKGSATLKNVMSANTAEMMLEACLEGIGIAMLPIFAAAEPLSQGKLLHILPNYETRPELSIHAVFPQNRYLSTKTRLFVDWLSTHCKDLPW